MIKDLGKFFITLILISIYYNQAYGATQGLAGSNSTGDLDITLTLDNIAEISYVDDANLGAWSGSGDLNSNDDICIYTNSSGSYNVTVTGDGSSSSFQLDGSGNNKLTYTANWNDGGGTNSGQSSLTSGTTLTGQSGADTSSSDCNSGANLNARLNINIAESDLLLADFDTYSGSVTITVAPE